MNEVGSAVLVEVVAVHVSHLTLTGFSSYSLQRLTVFNLFGVRPHLTHLHCHLLLNIHLTALLFMDVWEQFPTLHNGRVQTSTDVVDTCYLQGQESHSQLRYGYLLF